ncbi:MAG: hypothetical protein LBL90_02045, partial [Prevotellaceae bacterium]|nr:hypothetical protein [Prevotellaceae bacterium]
MKYLLFALTLFSPLLLYGQKEPRIFPPLPRDISYTAVIDSANIRVLYALNATDSAANKTENCEDIQALEIGDSGSKYYSYLVFQADSLTMDWKRKNPKAQSMPYMLPEDGIRRMYWSDCFKDYLNNTFTEYSRMPHG